MLVEHAYMPIACVNGQVTALAARALLLLTLSLGGCATSGVGSSLMDARAEVPAPAKTTTAYPAVEDLPPKGEIMPADEQSRLKKELTAARDRQAASVKAQEGAQSKPKKPQAAQPTNRAVRQ
jgi:hypothetical protein